MWNAGLLLLLLACGGTPPRPTLNAAAIERAAAPAIVTVVAGDSKRGTGFVVDSGGLVATPAQLVENERAIRIIVGAESYPATIVGVDVARGLALLRVGANSRLPVLRLADVAVTPGSRIYEVDMYGIREGSLRQVRHIGPDLDVLVVSATDPARWTGPMLDEHGDVIGVSAAFVNPVGIVIGVPVDYLRELMTRH